MEFKKEGVRNEGNGGIDIGMLILPMSWLFLIKMTSYFDPSSENIIIPILMMLAPDRRVLYLITFTVKNNHKDNPHEFKETFSKNPKRLFLLCSKK